MDIRHHYTTWTHVDLGAIESNVRYFVEHSSAQVIAVVKANGYGHGATQVAYAALRGGATWCAVARVEEAVELRRAGITCPILLMGFVPRGSMEQMIQDGVSMAVWDEHQIRAASDAAASIGGRARLHLKVDTGMSRLGAHPEQVGDLACGIKSSPELVFEGLFTHFARADESDPDPTDKQVERLLPMLQDLDRSGLRPPLVHVSNSAATLTRPALHYDGVRTGISIYGLHPSPECTLPASFRPALSWKTQLSQVKQLPPGRGLSYGHIYTTHGDERIGTLPVGYADGFRRTNGNQVLVGGKRVPVVGRVCMDQCLVQLDEVPEARAGDEVVLIGEQGAARISAEDVAQRWGTINYEVTCGIGSRVPRLYNS